MAVTFDLVGGRLEQTDEGFRVTRMALVQGGLQLATAEELLFQALEDGDLPAFGAGHPQQAGSKLKHIRTVETGCNDSGQRWVLLELTYQPNTGTSTFKAQTPDDSGPAPKAIRGALVNEIVSRDIAGQLIQSFKPPSITSSYDDDVRQHKVNKGVPTFILTFKRHELNPPLSRVRAVLGKVNSNTLGGQYAAGTLLCSRIDAQPVGAGESYQVTYEFQYNADGHEVEVVYTRNNGQVAAYSLDVGDDISHPTFQLYETDSFAGLQLDFSD